MVTIRNVSKSYGKSGVKAVDNMNWDIEDGKITGFIGPNGAGKTTTLKMITGITTPDHGEIQINGIDILAHPTEAKKQFGFVSDTPDNFLRLKGLEYLSFMCDIYGVPNDKRQQLIQQYAQRFDMVNALGDRIQSYSHGMRQKIMVMGALMHQPSVWILDEPMTGLDPNSAHVLKQMMREHADKGNAVIFSTHVLEVAEKLCDKVVVINKGRLLFQGTLDELKASYPAGTSLENIFLEITSHE